MHTKNYGIVLHGGAGNYQKSSLSQDEEKVYKDVLRQAVQTGYAILQKDGGSLEAVQKAVNILEDSPLFNAGRGAVFSHEGKNELDATVMHGDSLQAGGVCAVRHIKNPIDLAVAVMQKSPHVLLSEKGAEEFAKSQGFALVDTSYFYTEKRFQSLLKAKANNNSSDSGKEQNLTLDENNFPLGTVGAVALDKQGNLVAGTSSGGMTNKRWHRVGDSAVIGAGTYADNQSCAVSTTGWGEFFMRTVAAHDVSACMQYKGLSLREAISQVLQKIAALGGHGGIIGIDKDGNTVVEFNTSGMYRASMSFSKKDGEKMQLAIFA